MGVQSFDDFASSALVGLLWSAVSPAAGFIYAVGWMVIAGTAAIRARAPADCAQASG